VLARAAPEDENSHGLKELGVCTGMQAEDGARGSISLTGRRNSA
jgi:hypothetical protein